MHTYASGSAQLISVSGKGMALPRIFSAIRQQTGYVVFYNKQLLAGTKPVDLSVSDISLHDFLDTLFKNQPLEYMIQDKTIFLSPKQPSSVPEAGMPVLLQLPVAGQVLDEDNNPVIGVSVRVIAQKKGTVSGEKGRFSLTGIADGNTIEISAVGYYPLTIRLTGSQFRMVPQANAEGQSLLLSGFPDALVIKLVKNTSKLNEVVVNKGYYTTSKRLNTGSQFGISAVEIAKQPVNNPLEALIGRIPGLEITQLSGTPGTGFTIRIRGLNSVRTEANDPLYIIDGVPVSASDISNIGGYSPRSIAMSPLNVLNAADIASIDVLKDADATAIYGSRGANGVILITTKKASSAGTSLDVNVSSGIGEIARKADVLNRRQYLDMRYEAFKNDALDFRTAPASSNYDLMVWDTTRNTDWQKVLLGGTAHFTNAQVSLNGGNRQTSYVMAGGYLRQTSVYPTDFADQKFNGRMSISHHSLDDRFSVQLSTSYGRDDNKIPGVDLVSQALSLPPIAPPLYTAGGKLNFNGGTGAPVFSNPLAQVNKTYGNIIGTFISSGVFNYRLAKGLTARLSAGVTNTQYDSKTLQPSTIYDPTTAMGTSDYIRTSLFMHSTAFTWNLEPQLEYKASLHFADLSALAGTTFQKSHSEGDYINGYGYKDDDLLNNLGTASRVTVSNSITDYRYNAIFARIGLNRKNKYLLNLTARRDGSSRFGPGNQFGNFGAIGAAWQFGEESFIKNGFPVLSYGKLRASYGITGNDVIPDYNYLATYSAASSTYNTTAPSYGSDPILTSDKLENNNIRWETNRKAELGLELGFMKDRIMLDVDAYRNRSSNMLVNYSLPALTGFTGVISNLPALVQNTGLEFDLNTNNIVRPHFSWSSSFNLSLPKNKLLRYDNIESSSYRYIYLIGQPLNIARVAFSNVDPETGVNVFKDRKGGIQTINTLQLDDVVTPVNTGKQLYGGFGNTLTYRNWSFDIFFQFSKQNGGITNSTVFNSAWGRINNIPVYLYDRRWQQPGDIAEYQKLSAVSDPASRARVLSQYESYYFTDVFYVRLKNVAVSYTLPAEWLRRMKIKNARIYLQGQNLLTFTRYPGMDPENLSAALPPLRLVTGGLQFTF